MAGRRDRKLMKTSIKWKKSFISSHKLTIRELTEDFNIACRCVQDIVVMIWVCAVLLQNWSQKTWNSYKQGGPRWHNIRFMGGQLRHQATELRAPNEPRSPKNFVFSQKRKQCSRYCTARTFARRDVYMKRSAKIERICGKTTRGFHTMITRRRTAPSL